MYTYTYTYIHIHIHIHTYTYIHIYIHTYIHTYKHTYIHTYVRIYIHTYIHPYIHIYIHTYINMKWIITIFCINKYVNKLIHQIFKSILINSNKNTMSPCMSNGFKRVVYTAAFTVYITSEEHV